MVKIVISDKYSLHFTYCLHFNFTMPSHYGIDPLAASRRQ